MPSPFPGMDPYLESPILWPDFHSTLIPHMRAAINRQLPAGYIARLDRYLWIDESEPEPPALLGKPDAYVADTLDRPEHEQGSVAVLAAPVTAILPGIEKKGKLFIKILDAHQHRVVTVVELLSPANKTRGKDHDAYLHKRNEYLTSQINLAEIDLRRSGVRPPLDQKTLESDYYVMVSRAADFPHVGIWPFSVRDRLPRIPIPLKAGDPPVMLDLQQCVALTYDEAGYAAEIDYHEPPDPPLAEADAAWARERMAADKLY